MALFGKKKNSDDSQDTPADEIATPSPFSPKKAKAFFDHAETAHDSGNYEYAIQMWLSGLKRDPSDMDALKRFLRSAEIFTLENPKKGVSKEVKSVAGAKGDLGKFIGSLLDFGLRPIDTSNAIKLTASTAKLGLKEQTQLVGEHALKLAQQDKKPKKDMFVKLLDSFEAAEAFKLAAVAGEAACQMDRTDGELVVRVRNMLAQSTMSAGGYDNDEAGGFEKNIRNVDKQLELSQEDSASKTESTKDQIIERSSEEYKERPDDLAILTKYAKALVERGKSADQRNAMMLYNKAYKTTQQPRYRMLAGEVQLSMSRRRLDKLGRMIQAEPSNTEHKEKLIEFEKAHHKLEMTELEFRVDSYPTDLGLKFKLGQRFFLDGLYKESIEQFQLAQSEPKIKRQVLSKMAQAFVKLGGWEDAAIQTFEQALDGLNDQNSDLGMELRYGLMDALQIKAAKDREIEPAVKADKLAAGIAIQSFSYRDVAERRNQIKALISELKG
ncbi:MAG: hypothetical protein JKY96_06935 [Phycisphaerales bacterium]|nr:hypothetical protein [Phycisphaerales bacterium]